MLLSVSLVLWSLILGPLIYLGWRVMAWLADVRRRGRAVEQFPGEPKHWLWGHLHLALMRQGYVPCVKTQSNTLGLNVPGVWPGPNEAGLEMWREFSRRRPYCSKYPGPTAQGLAVQRQQMARHPLVQHLRVGPVFTTLILHHPETIRNILYSTEPKPLGLGVYTFGIPWLGEGLIISSGQKWARNRRLLTPAFHFNILKPYMEVNNRATDIFLAKIQAAIESGEILDIFSHTSLLTLDVILRCAFSYESQCQERGDEHPYVQAVNELSDLWVTRTLQPWVYSDFLYYLTPAGRKFKKHCNLVHSVTEEVIAKRKQTIKEEGEPTLKGGRYLDFLDILLTARDEDGQGLSDKDIRAEADTFLFAGHDTTGSSISWMLYSMACNPECQQRCQQEVDELLQGRDSDDIMWDDLPKLKYLTMCIKESMRLHTPVPFIERLTTKDMVIDGKTVPAGTVVAIQIYNLHHNPVIWEDPMEYRPDRFLPDNINKMDPYAFVPFSAGPRNCIGQNFAMHEQKTVLARLLHRFTFEAHPDFPVEKKIGVVMKTKDGMRLRIKPRHDP